MVSNRITKASRAFLRRLFRYGAVVGVAAVCALGTTSVAVAQGWVFDTITLEDATSASLKHPDQRVTFFCGEVTGSDTSLNEELDFPGPGYFHMVSPDWIMSPYDPAGSGNQSVTVNHGDDFFELPEFYFDVMGGRGWVSRIAFDDPFVQAIETGAEVIVMPELAYEFFLNANGLADGIAAMKAFCGGRSALPKLPVQEKVELTVDKALFDLAQVEAFAQCQAAYDLPKQAYHVADVTADGVDDLIVNFGLLKCTDGLFAAQPRGVRCVNGMCQFNVFSAALSGTIPFTAVDLQPVADRPGDLSVFMDAASCQSMGQSSGCSVRMRFVNQSFATVGVE